MESFQACRPRRAARVPLARIASLSLLLCAAGGIASAGEGAPRPNGFDLSNSSVPGDEIYRGGPPRDGIPALVNPALVDADDAPWRETDFVIGVALADPAATRGQPREERETEARAYPIAILEWHELVNDTLAGQPILVSWCPLCGTALVFDRRHEERVLEFGVSGLLYQSDLLMFDRATQSLWSQISAQAVSGELRGSRLRVLRSRMTTWRYWKQLHPNTKVLSIETGHHRSYLGSTGPYGDYATSAELRFPASFAARYHPKEPTLGVRSGDGRARAFPRHEVREAGGCIAEAFAGHTLRVEWLEGERSFDFQLERSLAGVEADRAPGSPGAPDEVEVIEGYWFAWSAFHPGSSVFLADGATSCPDKDDDRSSSP